MNKSIDEIRKAEREKKRRQRAENREWLRQHGHGYNSIEALLTAWKNGKILVFIKGEPKDGDEQTQS
jgi:hypothetical protein